MIRSINLLHYLSEQTYKKICKKFLLDDSECRTGDNSIAFGTEKVKRLNLFNIDYKQFGHIWFMSADIDFESFACRYDEFHEKLFEHYNILFGGDIMSDFPRYDEICCGYIEYSSVIKAENPTETLEKINAKFIPEQTDKSLWHLYKKPHGTIEFLVHANEDSIETLARCHGTALKKRITDENLHITVGLKPSAAVCLETENEIMRWICKKYGMSDLAAQ